MRKTVFFASLALAAFAFAASPAQAGSAVCKERTEIIKILANKFSETQRSFGLQGDRRVLELYASPNGSWTAILTMPGGKACVVASGEAWTQLPPGPVGEPA
ncbi:hypothetical protein RDV64_18945 [Acuticoccus sp. MNP-M23]|uniref:hypothetical protein n=1 Tax=Acuticoccus sp. MNP-M23 TaxID=3072793 RepID=UPI002814DA08|nr:hypothetical protein [Acuticoccus sp. MNP-M23]WMS42124.1 hypothetical protein RDV64_18945 [Acuticoccus sp. MNP-M23]